MSSCRYATVGACQSMFWPARALVPSSAQAAEGPCCYRVVTAADVVGLTIFSVTGSLKMLALSFAWTLSSTFCSCCTEGPPPSA